jgi:hypothetical protein
MEVTDTLYNREGHIFDLFAMDSKSIAIGFPVGTIKVFNRKNLSLEKVYTLLLVNPLNNLQYIIIS